MLSSPQNDKKFPKFIREIDKGDFLFSIIFSTFLPKIDNELQF